MPNQPRGVRNANPGNIRHNPRNKWQGLAADQPDLEFVTFIGPEWGIRAMVRVLVNYRDRHRITRLSTIIKRWAPEKGQRPDGTRYTQPTPAYIAHVERLTGFNRNQNIDLHSYAHVEPLVKAMIRHENGVQPYDQDTIDRGLELAGIVRPRPRKLTTPEARAGAVTAGGAGSLAVASLMSEAAPALPILQTLADHLPAAVLGVAVLAAGYLGWKYFRRAAT